MSRSFGDSSACSVGVHAVPEIKVFDLTPEDKIIVLASDGVWEFMEN
jgi:serine/threonine protein phosphatase PrpC